MDAILRPLERGLERGSPLAASFAQMAKIVGAALGEGPAVSRRTELFRPLPAEPMAWLRSTFPTYFQNARGDAVPMAPHHEEFWAWLWALRPGVAAQTLIQILSRGGGKSTQLEVGSVVIGYFGLRRYTLYICHAEGTPIYDPSLGTWMPVESHPTAQRLQRDGLAITVAGLPFLPEIVTPEHRYLARRVARRDQGHGKGVEIMYGRPHWIEAQDLDWNTWIGYPIDMTESTRFPQLTRWNPHTQRHEPWDCPFFEDPEWWWLFGLWWGDGTLGGARSAQIAFSCAATYPHIRQRLLDCLEDAQLPWHEAIPKDGSACSSISFCHTALARWLHTWRAGRNRKQPPAWVEQLPLEFQRALLRGYCDADGSLNDRGQALGSIHLPGLLAARRMLMRLGVPCYIGHRKRLREFSYKGRVYQVQPAYTLRLADAAALGYMHEQEVTKIVRDLFIRDGHLWSRVREIDVVQDQTFVPIHTASHTYYTHAGLSHNCDTQSQADDHVATVSALFEGMGVERAINKYGFSLGWNINRLTTADGYTQDAIGLDKAVRGVKRFDTRPDLIFLDELDRQHDTLATIAKKEETLTRAILPTGAGSLAVCGVQNLPNKDGIFAKLADDRADYLMNRHVSGPHPALLDVPEQDWYVTEPDPLTGKPSHRIVAGRPVWAGQDLAACTKLLNDIGPQAFLIECLHRIGRMSGTVFQRDWFPIVDDWPRHATLVRAWDFAATEEPGDVRKGKDPDWTVGLLLAMWQGQFWVVDMQRMRGTPLAVQRLVLQTAQFDGRSVEIWLEEEGGAAGKSVSAHYQRLILPGYAVRTWHSTGSKAERAKPVSAAAQATNVFLVGGYWNQAFLDEVPRFLLPNVHDDIVDALSLAHYALTLGRTLLPADFSLAPALERMTQAGMETRAQRAALIPSTVLALWGAGDDEVL